MKIVQAGYEIYPVSDGENTLKKVEQIARVCYKSEDKITEDSYKRMIGTLVKNEHLAMLEHGSIILDVNFSVYYEMTGSVNRLERDYNEKIYLRFTNKEYSGRYIISGNMRAWLEFLEACSRHGFIVANRVLEALFVLKYSSVFDRARHLAVEAFNYGKVEEIYYKDLTDKEKLVHGDISVKFTVDRGVSHEIVRHRVASFAQESTRYCNYGNKGGEITVIEPCYLKPDGVENWEARYGAWKTACEVSEREYIRMIETGATPQEARAVLPNSLKTEVVMTANLTEWLHFFYLRALGKTGKPHPQMVEVAVPLLKEMAVMEPAIFGGLLNE